MAVMTLPAQESMLVSMKKLTTSLTACFLSLTSPCAVQAQCTSQSPANKLALVELYTSEGCSSCPPAERWLSDAKTSVPGSTVALAFHVAYWDYLGWKDVYAKPLFSQRQRWLATLNRSQSVYTPGIFVNSQELGNWSNASAFDRVVASANSEPAQATIRITRGEVGQPIKVSAVLNPGTQAGDIQLHVASTSQPFTNKVNAGENKGEVLQHAHVVKQWLEPIVFGNSKTAAATIVADEKTSAVVALVQETKTGRILQTFAATSACF
jgi:hypothetical protein